MTNCIACPRITGRMIKSKVGTLCEACYAMHRYNKNKEDSRKSKRKTYAQNRDRIREQRKSPKQKFKTSVLKAKNKLMEWTIPESEYIKLMSKPCHYCEQIINEFGISLDRLDNNHGYHLNNVVTCCGDCNSIRSNILTSDEMKIGMKAIMEFRKCQK